MELSELNLNEEQLTGVNEYLESQIQAKLQSEGDKIRTKYNNKIKEYETQIGGYTKTIDELKEQLPVQKTPEQIETDNRIKALEEDKKVVAREKMELQLQKQLRDKGLNEQLHKYLNTEGVEDLETYLTELADVIGKQANNTYKPKSHTQQTTITKADFKKMSYQERVNLYNTNRELFNSLNKK